MTSRPSWLAPAAGLLLSLAGCLPLPVTYMAPQADDGAVAASRCSPIRDRITLVRRVGARGVAFELRVAVPSAITGTSVTTLHLWIGPAPQAASGEAGPAPAPAATARLELPEREVRLDWNGRTATRRLSERLPADGVLTIGPGTSWEQAITLPELDADRLEVRLPRFRLDGAWLESPPVTFTRTGSVAFFVLNC